MASPEAPSEPSILSQIDETAVQQASLLLGRDMSEFLQAMVQEEEQVRASLPTDFQAAMRSEARRLRSFPAFESCRSWSPQELAAAGFAYVPGPHNAVRCFCCGLALFHASFRRRPLQEHLRLRPDCAFLRGADVGNVAKYDVRVKPDPGAGPAGLQEEAARLASFQSWPFYANAVSPQQLAAAGFIFTGRRDTVRCFSCGGCLGDWEDGDDPWKEHAKWFPRCEFLRRMKSPEEIAQYIQSYKGFVGVTGEHFVDSWVRRDLPMASAYGNDSIFANEELRQESFKEWPQVSPEAAATLARAGLFYTGIEATVQCFSCESCFLCKAGADPLTDHAKSSPSCQHLRNLKVSAEETPDLPSCGELSESTERPSEGPPEFSAARSALEPESGPDAAGWFQEARRLSQQLRDVYLKASFRRLPLLAASPGVPTDLLLGCDLSLAAVQIGSPGREPVVLSDVLARLNSVACVEGEAGSGKTVFLKKLALLWASGCCPLLSRFRLVFYLSLAAAEPDQGLASMLSGQLLGAGVSVSETGLGHVLQQLKNQVLFLLDDYTGLGAVPHALGKLIQKNHVSRTCLLLAACTNQARDIRRYLDTTLEIGVFPFYHTVFLLRRVFPERLALVEKFMLFFIMHKTLQQVNKTPLFVQTVCAHWAQDPLDECFEVVTFKSYLEGLFRKHGDTANLKALVSACGQLALDGFFAARFKFSDEDLAEVGLGGQEEHLADLMSTFTAQRLKPVYQFLHPAFQEFLAGSRLAALLGSERREDQARGRGYLKQMRSTLMVLEPYENFLKFLSSFCSAEAGPIVVSHLLRLLENPEPLATLAEDDKYLQQHPEMQDKMQVLRALWQLSPQAYVSVASAHLLTLALKVAYQSGSVAACSPHVLRFLQGQRLPLRLLQTQYFYDHPESLPLLRSVQLSLQGRQDLCKPDLSPLATCFDPSQVPSVDQDCVPAFQTVAEWEQTLAEKEGDVAKFLRSQILTPPAVDSGYWQLSPKPHKIPLLEVHVSHVGAVDADMLAALTTVFPACQRIELHVKHSGGFLESIRPALEQCPALFTKCSVERSELSAEAQESLLTLRALEALEVTAVSQDQEKFFANLDKFPCLKELSVDLGDKENVFAVIPEGFVDGNHMEKLLIKTSAERSTSKLVRLIENSPNLQVFYLECKFFVGFESLTAALVSCRKLREMKLVGSFFSAGPFVMALPNFTSLKILNLQYLKFPEVDASETFAQTLGSLRDLEELFLPSGEGIHRAAKLIVQQCQHLPCLRVFTFYQNLCDDSLMEIAKVALDGGFQKLEYLDLSMNDEVTEEGYRNFFQALDNLPSLQELMISRHFTKCIKAQATTVTSLSRCVSRLPNLTRLNMLSWLLDEEDVALLNAMKERHPQSKRLTLFWQWVLPFAPVIRE